MVKFIEVTNGNNWGKFMLRWFTASDFAYEAQVDTGQRVPLLRTCGWGEAHMVIVDLATGEGAIFAPRAGGVPAADLDKHRIWVCPMFEPFLEWLYQQDLSDLNELPDVVAIDAPFEWRGYRRPGPSEVADYAPDYRFTMDNPEPGPEAMGQPPTSTSEAPRSSSR